MTKFELINRLAERLEFLSLKDTKIIVDVVFDSMTEALAKGDRIDVRGFGNFTIKERIERKGRNPKTGESVQIPARRTIYFKLGGELNERMNRKPT